MGRVAGNLHLLGEDLLLHVARRVIVKIIEPDFSDRNDFGSLYELLHPIIGCLVGKFRFVRVNSDCGVNKFVLLSQANPAVKILGPLAVSDRDDGLYTSISRTRDDLVAIVVIAMAFEMGVGVDVHGGRQTQADPRVSFSETLS